jgi:ERCC4-related helicase
MKGKLIKQNGIIDGVDYYLILDGKIYHTNPLTSGLVNGGKLSKQNCEAIANGYNLNELAYGYDLYEKGNFVGQMRAYKAGFQKAIELNKDKLFSQEDMYKMFIYGDSITTAKKNVNTLKNKPLDEFFNDFIQSLQQQTEWDVEILMEIYDDPDFIEDLNKEMRLTPKILKKPKLDNEGCLILKRI